jgi:alpha-D-xyloside xylohydrolase
MKSSDSLNDRSPWNIAKRRNAPEVLSICRRLLEEREKLLPYILEQAKVSANTGRPMMAALVFDFPSDEKAISIDDEYMFGEKLLVAPVVEQGATIRKAYLPKGTWRDYWTGAICEGPCEALKSCALGEMPVWELQA